MLKVLGLRLDHILVFKDNLEKSKNRSDLVWLIDAKNVPRELTQTTSKMKGDSSAKHPKSVNFLVKSIYLMKKSHCSFLKNIAKSGCDCCLIFEKSPCIYCSVYVYCG